MRRIVLSLSMVLSITVVLSSCSRSESPTQRSFSTPDSAATALARAVITGDTTALLAIMGPDSRPLILPTDQVQAAHDRQVVATALTERWWLEDGEDGSKVLVIGNESWPFPSRSFRRRMGGGSIRPRRRTSSSFGA